MQQWMCKGRDVHQSAKTAMQGSIGASKRVAADSEARQRTDDSQSTTSPLTSALSGAAGSFALTMRGARLADCADLGLDSDEVVKARARGIPWIVAAKLIVDVGDQQCVWLVLDRWVKAVL